MKACGGAVLPVAVNMAGEGCAGWLLGAVRAQAAREDQTRRDVAGEGWPTTQRTRPSQGLGRVRIAERMLGLDALCGIVNVVARP